MGGKSQLVGIVAGGTMLVILFFLTDPLAYVPDAGLAAVIVIASIGLFDFAALRELYYTSRRELLLSLGTTFGVVLLGALPGVLIAVALTFIWLLHVGSRPRDAILGRTTGVGVRGFHNIQDYPEAVTYPGLLVYRFEYDLLFYNVDYFKQRLFKAIAEAETPVEWVVVDCSPINVLDVTAVQKLGEIREDLAAQGIVLAYARIRRSLGRFFRGSWVTRHEELLKGRQFATVKAAVQTFEKRNKKAAKKKAAAEALESADAVANPADPAALAKVLQKAAADAGRRRQWAAHIPQVFETFSWDLASQALQECYDELLRG